MRRSESFSERKVTDVPTIFIFKNNHLLSSVSLGLSPEEIEQAYIELQNQELGKLGIKVACVLHFSLYM